MEGIIASSLLLHQPYSQSHVALWLSGSELMILHILYSVQERLTDMYDDVPEMSSFSVLTSAHSIPSWLLR